MSVNLRFPNITGTSDAQKLQQVQSYLHQLVQELTWAFENVGGAGGLKPSAELPKDSGSTAESEDAVAKFNDIKALIIKSADIVTAYYDNINARLKGIYVAQSDFGTFAQQTSNDIKATSEGISQLYTNIQEIITDIDNLENSLIDVNAYIHSGLLYYDDAGVPIYGLEIGQRTEIDGVETFNKYARFTSSKLAFYDSNDNEVAYISDKKLYITQVEITGSLSMGGFVETVLTNGDKVKKWVGKGG